MGGFRGDLSTLGLADIFQTLSNSQKEGTLVVGDGESRKCIYFGKEGLSLLSLGSRKGLRIGDLLLKAGKMSPDQLKELLAAQKGSGKKLGELVVERGIASEEEISGVIRTQIEDEIFDLFSWKKASFEFIDGPPSAEVMDADKPVTSLKFDVNSLLFEASRRIDEWQLINQAIPSFSAIFALTQAGQQLINSGEDAGLRAIAKLTDASRTVDQIVEESGLSRFAACKGLYELLTRKGIRQVSQDELIAMGKKLVAQGHRDRAIKILACAVDLDHDNLVPQQELALALRQAGRPDEAFVYYVEMGKIWDQRGRLQEALQSYRQALECRNNDPVVLHSVFKVLTALKMNGEAAKVGEQVFPALAASGDRLSARQVGETLVSFRPGDVDLRLRLAAICQDLGDAEACGRHLSAAIDNLPAGSADIDALARKVLAVLPNRTDIRFKMERLFSERRADRKKRVTRIVSISAGSAVLAIIVIFAWYEIQARREWQRIQIEADGFANERKWDQAKDKYLEIKQRFPWSFVAGDATQMVANLEKRRIDVEETERQLEDRKRNEAARAEKEQRGRMDEARRLATGDKPDVGKALAIYQAVQKWAVEKGNKPLAEEAGNLARGLEELLKKGTSLLQQAEEQLKTGNVESAHAIIRELLAKAGKTPSGLEAKLPYEVRSVPPGAEILVNGESIGRTPAVVRVDGNAPVSAVLKLRTFKDENVTLTPGTWLVTEELSKERLWRVRLDGAVETTPTVEAGQVVVGAMDSKLYAVSLGNPGALAWGAFSAKKEIQSSPACRDGKIFFGSNDGNLYCLEEKSGKNIWMKATGGPVKGSPVVTNGGLVLVGSSDGLYAFTTVGGDLKWKAATTRPVRSRPLVLKDRAIFGCDDNTIRAVDLNTGAETWKSTATGAVSGALATWNNFVIACSEDGTLSILSSIDGKPEWKYPAGGRKIEGGACVSGDIAYFGVPGALYAIDLKQRKEAWESPFLITKDKAIRGTPVVGDETVYFGAEDGFLYAVDQVKGGIRWKHATDDLKPIYGSPALAQDGDRSLILFGSSDQYLYALER